MSDANLSKKAKLRAMHLLERMDRTECGLRRKLSEKYPEEAIEEAIAYVKSYGYLDDVRYAQNYIRCRLKDKSQFRIFQELKSKGIKHDVISLAWEEEIKEIERDERSLVRQMVLQKYPAGARLDVKQMRRLQGFLARRGFLWEDISSVLEEEDIAIDFAADDFFGN